MASALCVGVNAKSDLVTFSSNGKATLSSSQLSSSLFGNSYGLRANTQLVSIRRASASAVNAKLGGLFGKKEVEEEEEEEAPVRGTGLFGRRGTVKEVAKAFERGSQKVKRGTTKEVGTEKKGTEKKGGTKTGGTKGLRGTLQLLFGGGESKPARELPRDEKVVFVAGATGKVGSRVVRELVDLGFKVRAISRNAEKAEELFAGLTEQGDSGGIFSKFLGGGKAKQVSVIELDLASDVSEIEEAIGVAGKVVCTIGAAENDAFNVTAPYKIDGEATKKLIKAAAGVGVEQFVLVSSLGTGKPGFPASLLNLFWGVLVWKAQAERALKDSGMAFAIVRPGGMERPKDDYKDTHNLQLLPADSLSGGQISSLQVAELIGSILSFPELSENKVIEAIASTDAPQRPTLELLAALPVVGLTQAQRLDVARREAEKAAQVEAEREAEEEKRLEEEREAEERKIAAQEAAEKKRVEAESKLKAAKQAAKLRSKLSKELAVAKEKEKELKEEFEMQAAQQEAVEKKRKDLRGRAEAAAQAAAEKKKLQKEVEAAAKQGRILTQSEKDAVIAKARAEASAAAEKPGGSKPKLFGGFPSPKTAVNKESVAAVAADVPPFGHKTKSAPALSMEEARAAAQRKVKETLGKKKAEEEEEKRGRAEQKAKAEAEVRAQKEEEERKKREEEERKREEEEEAARSISSAEAKAKEEEEEKRKAEESAKAAAEAKAKEEEEEKQAVAAKAKKEEEERVAKSEAEAEVKAKARSVAKVKEAVQAKAVAAKEELADAYIKGAVARDAEGKKEGGGKGGFRWPWQAAETEETVEEKEESVDAAPKASTDFPPSPTPLSPYTRFPDLKPPASPTPQPPTPVARAAAPEEPPAPPPPPRTCSSCFSCGGSSAPVTCCQIWGLQVAVAERSGGGRSDGGGRSGRSGRSGRRGGSGRRGKGVRECGHGGLTTDTSNPTVPVRQVSGPKAPNLPHSNCSLDGRG